jgi:hypothetical protein
VGVCIAGSKRRRRFASLRGHIASVAGDDRRTDDEKE